MLAIRPLIPGASLSIAVAALAWMVGQFIGGPALLYALLFGIPFHPLAKTERFKAGIEFTARQVLRFGVALLGLRITLAEILSWGWTPVLIVLLVVPTTILTGIWMARRLGLDGQLGVLSSGATAICGVSAAMAITAVLPERRESEQWLIITVIGVTTLSTVCMIAYPPLCNLLGLDPTAAGMFLGASIHDVAQVVGAGYIMSTETGDTATFTKLLRVAMLLPVVMCITLVVSRRRSQAEPDGSAAGSRPPLLPGFLIAFLLLIALNSTGLVPEVVASSLIDLSKGCLIASIAAIGVKAALRELIGLGWRPLLLLVAETAVIGLLALGAVMLSLAIKGAAG